MTRTPLPRFKPLWQIHNRTHRQLKREGSKERWAHYREKLKRVLQWKARR